MIKRTLTLDESVETKLNICAAVYGLSGSEFVGLCIAAGIATTAEQDPRMAKVLALVKD